MAKEFGFFNSINGDRKYLATDISQAFDIAVTTGLQAIPDSFKIEPHDGMEVKMFPGGCMIYGAFCVDNEDEIIELDNADGELDRIDRIVIRYDRFERSIKTAVIKGTPGLNPTPPVPLRDENQFDLVLADITVKKAMTSISSGNITDMRYSHLCGFIGVKGAVTQEEFDRHLLESAKKHIHSSGSNDDGFYIRFDDGTQECWSQIIVPYTAASECMKVWTYPVPFLMGAEPAKVASHNLETNIVKHLITGVRISRQSTELRHASAFVRALSAGGDFTSNSTVELGVYAIGRWKSED